MTSPFCMLTLCWISAHWIHSTHSLCVLLGTWWAIMSSERHNTCKHQLMCGKGFPIFSCLLLGSLLEKLPKAPINTADCILFLRWAVTSPQCASLSFLPYLTHSANYLKIRVQSFRILDTWPRSLSKAPSKAKNFISGWHTATVLVPCWCYNKSPQMRRHKWHISIMFGVWRAQVWKSPVEPTSGTCI
jgi:hypothetical protein